MQLDDFNICQFEGKIRQIKDNSDIIIIADVVTIKDKTSEGNS